MSGINTRSGGLNLSASTVTTDVNLPPAESKTSSAEADRLQAEEDARQNPPNEEENLNIPDIPLLLANAIVAQKERKRVSNVNSGLSILYKQKDGVNIACAEILALELSNADMADMLNRFTNNEEPPAPPVAISSTTEAQPSVTMLGSKVVLDDQLLFKIQLIFYTCPNKWDIQIYPLAKS